MICSTTSPAGISIQTYPPKLDLFLLLFFSLFALFFFFLLFHFGNLLKFLLQMQIKKKHFTFYSDFIFSKHYFYTLFICWLCRLFGSFPALGVSEKEFIISFYASYDLFLKPSWPDFLFFTFNLSEFLVFSVFFIWHNSTSWVLLWNCRLIDLSGSGDRLHLQCKCLCWKMGLVPLTFHMAA